MPSTTAERDFYDGKWAETDLTAGSLRNYLVRKERFFVRQLAGRHGRVLDLGCGGGWRLYTKCGPVVGVDLSHPSLRNALRIYQGALVADLAALPFAEDSFDLVVSSDVLGHVALEDKDAVLSEIHRVLRPGGRTLHYIEADGDDPLMRFAKLDRSLYRRHIVDPEGHIGMETPAATIDRFRCLGWRPIAEVPAYRGLTYLGRIAQYFDNEYKSRSRLIRALVALCKVLTASRLVELGANLGIGALIEIGDLILPPSWAGGVMVCYEKVI